jgi:cyclopropane-fatty-acyl-phospholipid synthase
MDLDVLAPASAAANSQIGSSAEELKIHYDRGNAFYELWLDPTMAYSCALFEGDESLEAAQIRKLDWHLDTAGVTHGTRLLDIGCGWGALLRHAAARFPDLAYTGLTISAEQVTYIEQRGAGDAEVRLEAWADHVPQEPYDSIISIGAFEHFGRSDATPQARLDGYRHFFACCRAWLKPGGRMSLQTIAYGNLDTASPHEQMVRNLYPGSELPALSDIAEASRGAFEIVAVRNDRQHYARTLRIWINALRARRSEAEALIGARSVGEYLDYLRASLLGFQLGNTDLLRLDLRRVETPRYSPAIAAQIGL